MAEDGSDTAPEGWHVPQRVGFIAAAVVPLVLFACIVIAGRAYDRDLRPALHHATTTFPAPGIETFIHDGRGDPIRPVRAVRPDPAIATAKQAVLRDGLAEWPAR